MVVAFVVVVVPPIAHEIDVRLTQILPVTKPTDRGTRLGRPVDPQAPSHRVSNGRSKLKLPVANGLLGAGRILLSVGVATVSIVALTIYFLIALPGVKRLWLSLIAPRPGGTGGTAD